MWPDQGKIYRSSSIKARLLILLVIMTLPFIAFSAFKAFDIHERLQKEAQEDSLKLAKNIAHDIDEYIISTGDVLS